MKRFVLNPTEERLLLHVLSEYRAARIGRDKAKATLATVNDHIGWRREFERTLATESLHINREAIRILTDVTSILRTQR
jgi:hypothetical protein